MQTKPKSVTLGETHTRTNSATSMERTDALMATIPFSVCLLAILVTRSASLAPHSGQIAAEVE